MQILEVCSSRDELIISLAVYLDSFTVISHHSLVNECLI